MNLTVESAARSVNCPACKAHAGEPCRTPKGKEKADHHAPRYELADRCNLTPVAGRGPVALPATTQLCPWLLVANHDPSTCPGCRPARPDGSALAAADLDRLGSGKRPIGSFGGPLTAEELSIDLRFHNPHKR